MRISLNQYNTKFTKDLVKNKGDVFKRYIFLETTSPGPEPLKNPLFKRVTIINYADYVRASEFLTGEREEVSTFSINFGEISCEGTEVSRNDIITIRESHFTIIYNDAIGSGNITPLDVHTSFSSWYFENMLRFHHITGKKKPIKNPFPEFFTIEQQMRNKGHDMDFGHHVVQNGNYIIKLADLLDEEYTVVNRVNFEEAVFHHYKDFITEKHNMDPKLMSQFGGDIESQLYQIFALCKHSLESNGYRKGVVIFDNIKGMNFVPQYADMMMKTPTKDQINIQYINLVQSLDMVFNNMFLPNFTEIPDLNIVLYMYFSPYTNKFKILFPQYEQSTMIQIPPAEIIEDIVENKSIG